MKYLLIASSALLGIAGFSSTASAQAFDGPFIGAQLGWNHDNIASTRTSAETVAIDNERDAFVGGAFIGYDYKVTPHVVIGAEAGFSLAADDRIEGRQAGRSVSIDPEYSIDLTARAGYLVQENTLLYVRGGYSNVRVKAYYADAGSTLSDSHNRDAWMVGGGVEHAIRSNISARLEYRYSDLSEGRGAWDRHQVLIGAAYRF